MCTAASGGACNRSGEPRDAYAEHTAIDGDGAPAARRLILFYQEHLSGLKMGSTCRFDPTCSNYALTAFTRHGFLRGAVLTVKRLARCGPWHPGGWDPVPPRRTQRH
ncbi:membrane protein insertion efficiency factor YidD [Corynebacterium sp. zg254]|uniref:Putative membrane protein insertion efficiency factor n=1 Tax=Corynebacterium zhongnanshanii TaxID=2768834 RepID=A0ABQ6VCH3_9CORY|nr:membrane protein insertion efficiency factor YidD [Corynebacterium zhongnanshanii]MCR5915023.1 membrane protein insertion efficiency factor YidD [Corynebacterium sp. zg254]